MRVLNNIASAFSNKARPIRWIQQKDQWFGSGYYKDKNIQASLQSVQYFAIRV